MLRSGVSRAGFLCFVRQIKCFLEGVSPQGIRIVRVWAPTGRGRRHEAKLSVTLDSDALYRHSATMTAAPYNYSYIFKYIIIGE